MNITEWNRKAAEISSYTGEEVMGKPFLNFIEEEFQVSVGEVLKKAMTGEETANYELPLVTKNGERLFLLVNATSRRDAAGQVVGVIGIAQDITDVKRREVEISRLLDDAQRLIDTANAPIFGVDQNMNVTEWNRKAGEISAYTQDEVMGKPFLSFIEEELRAGVGEVLKRAMTGEETANYELPLVTKKGGRLFLLVNATSRRDAA